MTASFRRITALLLRYMLLVRRDPSRVVDLCYWPLLDVVVWGLLTYYVGGQGGMPHAMAMFLGGAILWNLVVRAGQDVSVSFLDDVWARSVVTIFTTPLTIREFSVAILLVGAVKAVLALGIMSVVAALLFAFDILDLGWALVPFGANLILVGWTLGMVALAIIVHFGGRWQIIAWSLPFLVMPVSSVFYPEAVLPPGFRAIARVMPANHVFEGMRTVLFEARLDWNRVAWAAGLNLLYLALASALVAAAFRSALQRGALPKLR